MQNGEFLLTVNDSFEKKLSAEEAYALDMVQMQDGQYHLLKNGKSYLADVVSINFELKTVHLRINGKSQHVKIADHFDLLVKKMGLSANVIHKISEIKAPMPGLVLSISVEPGQEVVHGDPLLILEAMKMENVLKSPGEGKIKRIVVSKGKAVDKGELLIELE